MRKLTSILLCVLFAFSAMMFLSGMDYLHYLAQADVWPEEIDSQNLASGRIMEIFTSGSFWSHFPALPHAGAFFDLPTLLLTLTVLGFIVYAAIRRHLSHRVTALFCICAGLLPYLVGRLAIQFTSGSSYAWILLMLMGAFYCFSAGTIFALIDVFKAHNGRRRHIFTSQKKRKRSRHSTHSEAGLGGGLKNMVA